MDRSFDEELLELEVGRSGGDGDVLDDGLAGELPESRQ